jgi:protoporphyrinogen oxidase
VAGVGADLGSHRLHPATPPHVLADLRRLLGADLQTRRRNGRLRVAGRWVGFPLRSGELLRALPPSLTEGIAFDALTAPLRRPRADTYAEVLRAGLSGRLYDALYAPYAEKLWGLPLERVDGEQARRRVTADTPWKIAARLLRGGRDGQGRVFHYPRRGFGQIVEALAAAATDAGAEIRLGTEVTRVDATGDRVGIQAVDGADRAHRLEAGHVLSTVPLPLLARLAGGPVPDPPLRFRAIVLVYLVHEGPRRWTPYDAHYLPGPEIPVTRVSELPGQRGGPPDRTVLCAEIPCGAGDPTWTTPDDDLVRAFTDGLARVGLPPVRRSRGSPAPSPPCWCGWGCGGSTCRCRSPGSASGWRPLRHRSSSTVSRSTPSCRRRSRSPSPWPRSPARSPRPGWSRSPPRWSPCRDCR